MSVHSINHGEVGYRVIPLEDCFELAMGIQCANKKWHSHVLSPACMHNPYPGSYAVVIENDSDGVAYISPSQSFPEVDKDFVRILHGDDILEPSKVSRDEGSTAPQSELLLRLFDLDSRRVAWHHHMHFPSCVLSPHRGQWAIVIESAEGTFSETFEGEPVGVLREIEVMYFRNLDRQNHNGDQK